MKRAWRRYWHLKADHLRTGWSAYVAEWEADTEVGCPMSPMDEARREFGLNLADFYDAIGGRR